MAVVGKPVQQRSRQLGIAEHARPFRKAQVGRDRHTGVLVEFRQQVEQQGPAGLAERQIPQFAQDHQVHARQPPRNPPGMAVALLFFQRIDQIDRRVESYPACHAGQCPPCQWL